MRKALIVIMVLAAMSPILPSTTVLAAPKQQGGLTDDLIAKLRSGYKLDHKDQAIYNALTGNDINALAVNHDQLISHNAIFNKEIKTGDITNQESSGRCWMFAGLNKLRPAVMNKLNLGTFKMSTNYLFFWDKLEKANVFLETVIATADRDINDRELVIMLQDPCPDGGWWSYVVQLIDKYGVAPEQVMPETFATANTGNFNSILGRKLRKDAAVLRMMYQSKKTKGQMREEKEKMLTDIFRIVAMNFGEPPQKFSWRYVGKDSVVAPAKEYTPQQFYQEMIGYPLHDFVCIFNYPGQDYFKRYKLEESRNLFDGENFSFINLPIDSLKRYAMTSVLSDEPVWFACDVGKENHRGKGILEAGIYDFNSVYGVDVGLTKEERIKYRDSSPNHAMVFTGVDTADGKTSKWKVENSWGTKTGDNGWWTLYDDWFNEYVYIVIVDRKHLPPEVAALLGTTPITLPPWDPMWDFAKGINWTE